MSTVNDRIRVAFEKEDISFRELERRTGISRMTLQRYTTGETKKIGIDEIEKIAIALHTTSRHLVGWEDIDNSLNAPTISDDDIEYPVIAEVAAGFDKVAVEEWTGDRIKVPLSYLKGRKPDEFFVLKIKGDSMYPMYIEGDKVLVLRQTTTDYNGQVAIVIYDDELGTIKKVEQKKNSVDLVPINPHCPPEHITGEDIEKIHILGIPKILVRDLDED